MRRRVISVAMVSAAGWRVERAFVTGDPSTPRTAVLRVSWRGYWQADCATTSEVEALVDTATLVPEGWSVVRPLIAKGDVARRASSSR